jgi:CrcB protein
MITALVWVGVAVFGGLGAFTRFRVDDAVSARWPNDFPLGTFIVNCSGAFVLGLLVGVSLAKQPYLVFGTGFLGGYTTFSTWMFESERLAEAADFPLMWLNLFASIGLGLGLAGLGWLVGAALV